jgi:outer membrane biogenesis lipoprotein LolB
MRYFLVLFVAILAACSTTQQTPPNQELVIDAKIQQMGRQEVIDAVKQCETSGLRAIPIYAKRKIGGYTVETVVEVTCGPRYAY